MGFSGSGNWNANELRMGVLIDIRLIGVPTGIALSLAMENKKEK